MVKKYIFNLISSDKFDEHTIDTMYEFMDDGNEESRYAVVGKNIDDDGEGHLTIKGTYPDDHYEDYEYPETDFGKYDIHSALENYVLSLMFI